MVEDSVGEITVNIIVKERNGDMRSRNLQEQKINKIFSIKSNKYI